MYNCRYVRDNGDTFYFDYDHGVIFDVDPLSQLDIDTATSQGFNQVGETVENQSVGGISREINGKIFRDFDTNKELLLDVFAPFTSGKLYFNDEYYCDCVVSKTPAINMNNKGTRFSMVLFCSYPYWLGAAEDAVVMNEYAGAFQFPVCYDTHIFGIRSESAFTTVRNSGNVNAKFNISFTVDSSSVENYGLLNVNTMERLTINDTLSYGETVTCYWDGSRLRIEKTDADGNLTNIFALLDEDSNLFYLYPGDNVLETFADEGSPLATITYRDTYTGVYDGI